MRGLLYKDWLTLCKTKLLFLYVPIVTLIPLSSDNNMLAMMFPSFFAAMLPLRLLSMDEKSRWDQYTQTLPVSRAQLVHAKYLIGLFLVVGFSALGTASKFVQAQIMHRSHYDVPATMVTMVAMGLIINALMMPFVFKFGTEKGMSIYYAALALCGLVTGLVYGVLGAGFYMEIADSPWMLILPVVSAVIFGVSWCLSVRFYQNRDL